MQKNHMDKNLIKREKNCKEYLRKRNHTKTKICLIILVRDTYCLHLSYAVVDENRLCYLTYRKTFLV